MDVHCVKCLKYLTDIKSCCARGGSTNQVIEWRGPADSGKGYEKGGRIGSRIQTSSQSNHFFAFFFLFLQSVSRRYLTDAHSRMTASSFGIVAFNSFSSTTPSARVFAMLSSAEPTSFMRLEIT